MLMHLLCRSQWPRSLRHVLSSTARTLGSWVRLPLEAWMSAFFCVVLLCVGRGVASGWYLEGWWCIYCTRCNVCTGRHPIWTLVQIPLMIALPMDCVVQVSLQQTINQSVLASSPFWVSWPDVKVLSDHYGFSRRGAFILMRGRVYLLLVVMFLSGATIQKIKLYRIGTVCNIYSTYNMYLLS
jgi:hypothetical protein